MIFEYYTFPGNGEVIRTVFNAVAMFSGSSTMQSAAMAASLFGFVTLLGVAAFKLDLRDSFASFLGIFFIWMTIMTPKSEILVTEASGYGFSGTKHAVSNIPFGLAVSASFISAIGYHVTNKMEQVYTLPGDLNYSKTGMVFGSRLYEKIHSAHIKDPILIQDWALFMHQCSFFDLNMYRFYTINDVRSSSDLLGLIGNTNVALFTNVTDVEKTWGWNNSYKYKNTSTSMSCQDAYAQLKTRTTEVLKSQVLPSVAQNVFGPMSVDNILNQQTALTQLGNTSFQYLLNNARFDTLKNIEQASMVNLIEQTGYINNQRDQNAAAIQQAFATAQARNQYITAQKTGWYMASENLPLIRAAAEAILIGVFPLVIIIGLLGGIMAFKSIMYYLGSMLWIQLWAPVASILNLIMTVHAKSIMSSAAVGANGIIAPGTSNNILIAAIDAQAAAASAYWLVPVIAAAVAMGGRSLANVFVGMTAAARAPAEKAGTEAGAGNFSAGNMTYNNANANKYSVDPVYSSPALMTAHDHAGTSWTSLTNGNNRYQARNDSMGNIASTSSIRVSDMYSHAADENYTSGQRQAATAQESLQQGTSQALAFAAQYATNQSASSGYGLNLDASDSRTMNRVQSAASEISQKHGLTNSSQVASEIMLGLSGRIGWSGKATNNEKLSEDIGSTVQAMRKEGVSFSQSAVDRITSSEAFNTAVSRGDSLASSANASFSQAESATLAAENSFATAQSYREQASHTAGSDATVSIDNARAVKEYASQHGLSVEDVYRDPSLVAEAAMGAAAGNMTNLKQHAEGTAFSLKGDLTPTTQPTDMVVNAHARNAAGILSDKDESFASVSAAARQAGVSGQDINRKLLNTESGLSEQFTEARGNVDATVSSVQTEHQDQVTHLNQQAQQLGRSVEGLAMRLNSKQLNPNTSKVQQDIRAGKGDAGSGYDNVFAHVVDNPNFRDTFEVKKPESIMDMPGNNRSSGRAVFHPKKWPRPH